ncbi:unknown [Bacteroides sp. CAG:462]|nr:unknown [Bacteroides sp. CAG:462]
MLQYADYDLVVSGYDCDKYISTSGGGEIYSLQYLSRHM